MKTQPAQPKTILNRHQAGRSPSLEEKTERRLQRERERLAESASERFSEESSEEGSGEALQQRLPLEPAEKGPKRSQGTTRKSRRSPASHPAPGPSRPMQESLQLPQFPPMQPAAPPEPAAQSLIVREEPGEIGRQQPVVAVLQQQIQSGHQYLEATAAHINQLAEQLEAALFDLKAISTQVNQDRRALRELGQHAAQELQPACEYGKAAIPRVRRQASGSFHLVMRRVDLLKPEREAASTAQFLRNWSYRRQAQPETRELKAQPKSAPPRAKATQAIAPVPQGDAPKSETMIVVPQKRSPRPWRWLKRWLRIPPDRSVMVTDAVVWIVGAAILRVGLQLLLAAHPSLWIPVILLLVTPTMVVAYQVTLMAQSGLTLGYRLLLLLLGLLLGGRL